MQMNQKEYINPFSQVSEIYAQKLDDASMSGDIELLEQLISEIEKHCLTLMPHRKLDCTIQLVLYTAILHKRSRYRTKNQ